MNCIISGERMKHIPSIKIIMSCLLLLGSINQLQSINSNDVHSYFWANYNQFRGNKAEASNWYQGIHANTAPLHAYPGYIHYLNEIGNYAQIVEIFPKIQHIVQDNPKLQLIYALALGQTGQKKKSDEELVKLQRNFKSDREIAFYTANAFIQSKELENAISVLDDFLKSTPRRHQNFVFYFMKSQLYAQLNKYEEAVENSKLALKLHPQFDKGWLLLALLEEQAGKLQEAIEGYTSYLEVSPQPNKNIQQHLLQLTLKQELAQQNKRIIILDPACFEKAAALFERKQFRQALSTIEECLKKSPEHTELRLLKLRTLMAMDQHTQAADTVMQWIEDKPQDELWYQAMHLLVRSCAKHEITERIIGRLRQIEQQNQHALLPALYLADLSLRSQAFNDAQNYLKHAFNRANNPALQVKILYQHAVVAFQSNDPKLMGDLLEQAHNLDPNFIPVANLLAHYCATTKNDLERAQRLISAALEKHPRNVHLLDTQAMIYEREKKDQEAKQIRETLATNPTKCTGCDNLLAKK